MTCKWLAVTSRFVLLAVVFGIVSRRFFLKARSSGESIFHCSRVTGNPESGPRPICFRAHKATGEQISRSPQSSSEKLFSKAPSALAFRSTSRRTCATATLLICSKQDRNSHDSDDARPRRSHPQYRLSAPFKETSAGSAESTRPYSALQCRTTATLGTLGDSLATPRVLQAIPSGTATSHSAYHLDR